MKAVFADSMRVAFVRRNYRGPGAETLPADPDPASGTREPWLTDGVRHALNCTHTEYRNRHYEECVQEPSDVYRRPDRNADDDIGFLAREDRVLYARLEPVTTGGSAAAD